jgi:broad specificity phosphatase PhoE
MRASRLLLLLLCAALFAAAKNSAPTTVIIVRHAEKQLDAGDDPHLTDAGVKRADALARVVGDAHVDAIYVSQFQRTKETAAAIHGVPVTTLPVDKSTDYPKLIADAIRKRNAGQTVLVVSHSNIVPGIVEELTKIKVPPIPDDEFSRLYIVTLRTGAPPQLIAAQYGCP